MDPITHLTNKLMAERARQPTQLPSPTDTIPPPPYSAPSEHRDADSDLDEDADDEEDDEPLRLTLNAQHAIHGNNNLVPTSPTPLADATKFSTLLLGAVQQLNAAQQQQGRKGRGLRVDLTINCGITVVGDRNVIGHVGLKPRAPGAANATVQPDSSTVAGAKRKADEVSDEEPPTKKIAAAGAAMADGGVSE